MEEKGTFGFIHLFLLRIFVVSCVSKEKQKEQGSKELNSKDAYCYCKEGEVYAIYLPNDSDCVVLIKKVHSLILARIYIFTK